MSDSLRFTLPWPPSVNRLWRHISAGKFAGRVLISAEGRGYRQEAIVALRVQKVPLRAFLTGDVAVSIKAYPPDRRRRDLDNLLKASLDVLQHSEILKDDHQIADLRIIRMPADIPAKLVVELEKCAEFRR